MDDEIMRMGGMRGNNDLLSYVLASLRRASDNAYSWSLTPSEAGSVVAEIERLRKEVEDARKAVAEVERLRGEADRECVAVLNYLSYRIEMSHYADAIDEFINAHHEISEGIHRTLDYDEVLP
jgi:uncharacterized coiled-coil DUF342 family protein